MEIKLVCSNRYFKLNEDVKDFLFEDFVLSENNDLLFSLFGDQMFISRVGLNAIPILERYPHFICTGSKEDIFRNANVSNEDRLSEKRLEVLQFFIFCLWFIKDNSANTDHLYTYVHSKELAFSRTRTVNFSTAKGEYIDVSFSLQDLQKAKELFYLVNNLRTEKTNLENQNSETEDYNTIKQGDYNSILFDSQNRIDRAILFLTLARGKSYLPLKISFYISIYESLFTTDNSEVSHKVTERATLYLGGDLDKRLQNFKLIKTAYNIRSKFVHGQQMDRKKIKDRSDLVKLSNDLDIITRELLLKIITIDSKIFLNTDENLNAWFTSILLQ